jgi:hypothetical protein
MNLFDVLGIPYPPWTNDVDFESIHGRILPLVSPVEQMAVVR